jgi:uncharacterized membrane protein YbhN (UPF0104 family)
MNDQPSGLPDKKNIQEEPKSGKTPSWRWLLTALAILIFIVVLSRQDWDTFLIAIKKLSWQNILTALAALLFSRLAVAGRWYALLRISEKEVPYTECLKLTFAGLFASNFLPTSIGGDVVRLIGLIQMGVEAALSTASLIMDRLVGLGGMSLFLPYGIYLVFHPADQILRSTCNPQIFSLSFSLIPSIRNLWQKALGFLKKIWQSILLWLKYPASLSLSFGFTFIHMACLFFMLWILLQGLDEPMPFLKTGAIYSLSYIITLFPISISGLGIQEISIAYFYSHLGGISIEAGIALAILIRISFMLTSLPGTIYLQKVIKGKKR